MSYVLDALEKSERERQQNHPPNILSTHSTEPSFGDNRRRQKLYLIYGFLLLLLILLVGGIFTISFSTKQEVKVQQEPATKTELPVTETKSPVTTTTSPDITITPPQRQIIINPEVATVLSEKDFDLELSYKLLSIFAEKKKIRFLTPTEVEPSEEQTGTLSDTIPLLKDLPAELQKEIPELKFSGHAFSTDPGRRMIIVNNQILREGDSIDSITTLKEITWEGAIVDFGGILFRIEDQ